MAQTVTISVTGMSCASCVGRVERALQAVDGVEDASVNLATESATLLIAEPDALSKAKATLDEVGYPAATQVAQLDIEGMHCGSCVGRVENLLKAQPGVVNATVNLATQSASVEYFGGEELPSSLATAVSEAGYAASPVKMSMLIDPSERRDQEMQELRHALLISAALTLPVFVLEMGSHFVPGMHGLIGATIGHEASWLLQFVLTTAVLIGPGRRFFSKGVPALVRRAPDMNSLVAVGTAAAWGYSTLALFLPSLFPEGTRAVYFEAAAVITTLILLGRFLEARAKGRTGAAITRLMGLRPQTALVERGSEVTKVEIADIVPGDILHVRPGARLAVDGLVIDGESYVDESMISGEPVPVLKQNGHEVIGGTVNGNGALKYRATAVGEDTMLAQIVRLVQEAQGAKLPIQALVDRITGVFVPVVMGLAALTILVWLMFGPDPALSLALVAGVSVLIIACPCAMGLATPTSIMVGTGRAAEFGVLFRRGDALQALHEARILAVDKTGTLTKGAPAMTTFEVTKGLDKTSILPLIAAAEAKSEHPIAQAIASAADGLSLPAVSKFEAITGMGIRAEVDGHQMLVGADRFMAAEGIELNALIDRGKAIAALGQSPFYAAIDGQAVALIGVSDPIKSGTRSAIRALRDMGLRIAMITGDSEATAQAIANDLGIDEVVAEVLPQGKLEALADLRRAGGKIAFVGDGINDAPALAEADVGIAIGTGTDVAMEAADVVLISGDLRGVVNAMDVSRRTMRNIKQNLFWAFAYNAALIPVAAGILYPLWGTLLSPMLAAGAMALSSVFVLSNALRLRNVRPLLTEGNQRDAAPVPTGKLAEGAMS